MALPLLPCANLSTGIQHQMQAGAGFDGALPTGAITVANGMNKFASDAAHGGLFDFGANEPMFVQALYLQSHTAAASWTLSLISLDVNGSEITAETVVLKTGSDKDLWLPLGVLLLPGQALKLTTSNQPGAMTARVIGVLQKGAFAVTG